MRESTQYCSYCNSYFLEDPLDHLSSKAHRLNVLESQTTKSTLKEYKNFFDKRSISEENYRTILSLGKQELSNSDFKSLEFYLSNRKNKLGGEKREKHRRVKVKAYH